MNLLYFGLTRLSPLISNMHQVYYKYSANFVKRINESSSNQPGTFALCFISCMSTLSLFQMDLSILTLRKLLSSLPSGGIYRLHMHAI